MAPCVEPASQPAPVPDSQGPLFEEEQNELSVPALLKLPPHAPTHPNSAVCSALRSAGQNLDKSYVLLPHRFWEASQKSPVVAASQSVVPHAQLDGLIAVPSVVAQVGTVLQRSLLEVSQKSPVADVQAPESPQTQRPELVVAPLLLGQAGAVKVPHRQIMELSQEPVAVAYPLKTRLLPPLLLSSS